jgi:O-antigen/teichoic acid export membrane protein
MLDSPKQLSIKGRIRFLFKDSVIYGGAGAIRTLIGLFTFPVLTRYFSVADYGIIDAFNVLATLLVTFIIFGQDSAIARYFYEYEDSLQRKKVVSQSLTIQIAVVITCIPFLYLYANPIARHYTNQDGLQELALLVIYQIPFSLLINFSSNLLKWTFKRFQFLFIQLGSSFTQVMTIILGVIFFDITVVEVFQLILVVRIVFSIIGIFLIRKWITLELSGEHYTALLKYGVPYGVIGALFAVVPAVDRFVINKFLSPVDLGLYAAALKTAMLIQLPIKAFQTAWGPFYLSLFKEENASQTYNKILQLFVIVISITGLALVLFAKPVIIILASSKYVESATVVFPIVFGTILLGLGAILTVGIDLSKKSYLKLYSTIFRAGLTISMVFLFVQFIGLFGVALGFLLGQIGWIIFETFLAYRVYPLRFKLGRPIVILALATSLAAICLVNNFENPIFEYLINLGVICAFLLYIWLFPLNRQNIFNVIKHIKS